MWRFTVEGGTWRQSYEYDERFTAEIVANHFLIGLTGELAEYTRYPWQVVEASPDHLVLVQDNPRYGRSTATFERLPDGSGKGK